MAAMVHILITCCAVFTLTSVSMAGRPDSAAVVFSDKADAVPGVLPKETVEQKSDPYSVAVVLTEKAVEQKKQNIIIEEHHCANLASYSWAGA